MVTPDDLSERLAAISEAVRQRAAAKLDGEWREDQERAQAEQDRLAGLRKLAEDARAERTARLARLAYDGDDLPRGGLTCRGCWCLVHPDALERHRTVCRPSTGPPVVGSFDPVIDVSTPPLGGGLPL